ncbi:MAG: squalene/phytoene synthase family protein [Allosphingosinicella sp.]|uniref:squalene/phytoene synthase family protein n=1 Tax=Allosphingosinicella sp. TaxID=2823234 RepID=UPI003952B31F
MNADVALALASVPEPARAAVHALWALDEALGRVLSTGREPMISRIRLAWWREALERLDREPPPKEPVLESLAREVLPRGVTGVELGDMEPGWAMLPGDQPITRDDLETYAKTRGGLLFSYTARLLGSRRDDIAPAGEAWALVDLARHSSEASDVEAALNAARERHLPRRWPKTLRPLGMLAALAERDLKRGPARWEEPGSPPRTARMLRHRITGW